MNKYYQVLALSILVSFAMIRGLGHSAAVPGVIPYHGRLTDLNGFSVTQATEVTFSIYSDSVSGAAAWSETTLITPDQDGSFTHLLGCQTPFDSSLFDGHLLYLGLKIAGNKEMRPRFPIGSVPYALETNRNQILPDDIVGTAATLEGDNRLSGTNIFSGPVVCRYADPENEPLRAENFEGGGAVRALSNSDNSAALTAVTGVFYPSLPGVPGGTGPIIEGFHATYSVASGLDLSLEFSVAGDGTVTAGSYHVDNGGGVAEVLLTSEIESSFSVGDVVEIDPGSPGSFRISSVSKTTLVAGIITDKAGFVGNPGMTSTSATEIVVAVSGIVPCNVSDESGPIRAGDLLVASSTAGHAMYAEMPAPGTLIGKALGNHASGLGTIYVLITLR